MANPDSDYSEFEDYYEYESEWYDADEDAWLSDPLWQVDSPAVYVEIVSREAYEEGEPHEAFILTMRGLPEDLQELADLYTTIDPEDAMVRLASNIDREGNYIYDPTTQFLVTEDREARVDVIERKMAEVELPPLPDTFEEAMVEEVVSVDTPPPPVSVDTEDADADRPGREPTPASPALPEQPAEDDTGGEPVLGRRDEEPAPGRRVEEGEGVRPVEVAPERPGAPAPEPAEPGRRVPAPDEPARPQADTPRPRKARPREAQPTAPRPATVRDVVGVGVDARRKVATVTVEAGAAPVVLPKSKYTVTKSGAIWTYKTVRGKRVRTGTVKMEGTPRQRRDGSVWYPTRNKKGRKVWRKLV